MNQQIRVDTSRRVVVVDDEAIPFAADMSGRRISVTKTGITVDGYRLRDGAWEKRGEQPTPGFWGLLRDLLFG